MKHRFNLTLSLSIAMTVALVGVTHPEPALGWSNASSAKATLADDTPVNAFSTGAQGPAVLNPEDTRPDDIDAAIRLTRVSRAAHRLHNAQQSGESREAQLVLADELGQAVVALGAIEYLFNTGSDDARKSMEVMPHDMRQAHQASEREIRTRLDAFRIQANRLHAARLQRDESAMLNDALRLAVTLKDQDFSGGYKPISPDSVRNLVSRPVARAPALNSRSLQSVLTRPRNGMGRGLADGTAAQGERIAARAATSDSLAQDSAMAAAAIPGLSTDPAAVTSAIQALADQLGRSPIRIQNWVHDNIRFTPTYGVLRGAQRTLVARQGNAYDTNLLLTALLRASGYRTRYVYGTVQVPIAQVQNWVGNAPTPEDAVELMSTGGIPTQLVTSGGRISAVRFEHLWIEAHVDFIPSRGVIERQPDTWVPLDASFKQHTYTAPMDVVGMAGGDLQATLQSTVDSMRYNGDGALIDIDLNGFVNGMDAAATRVTRAMPALPAGQRYDIDHIMGRQTIVPLGDEVLAGTLPYRVVARSATHDAMPESLLHVMMVNRFDTRNDYALDAPSMQLRIPTFQLGGHSIHVEYEVATDAQRDALAGYAERNDASLPLSGFDVRPLLKMGDLVVATGSYGKMGTIQMWSSAIVDPHGRGAFGQEPHEYAAGSKISFMPNLGGVTEGEVAAFVDPLPDTVRLPVAQALHLAGMQYWFMSDLMGELSAKGWGGRFLRRPSVGAFAAPLQVSYFFGIPRTGFHQGFSTDIKADNFSVALGDPEKRRRLVMHYGTHASLNEGLTWELLQSGDAGRGMSAASMLARAAEQKNPIHVLTRENIATVLPRLQLSTDAEHEIQQSVNAGLIVLTPEREYSDGRAVGAGYVILDPETGGGIYRIDGGLNGAIVIGCIAKAVLLDALCRSKIAKRIAARLAALGVRALASVALAAAIAPPLSFLLSTINAVLITVVILEAVYQVAQWVREIQSGIRDLTPEELAELGLSAISAVACSYRSPCARGKGGRAPGRKGGGRFGAIGGFFTSLLGGNPIAGDDGVKFQAEIDYQGGGAFPLAFERHYYSHLPNGGVLGHKWGNRYFSRIRFAPGATPGERPDAVLVARGEGGWFQYVYRAGQYVANADTPERLQRTTDLLGRTTGWVYTTQDDEIETYNADGVLLSIRSPAGLEQTLQYNAQGQLVRVTDDAGRSLGFAYDEQTGQLVRMTDPLGRAYAYAYSDEGALTEVRYPGGTSRRYHYELEGRGSLLTGITDERGIRYVTWKYDYLNRATESVKAGEVERYVFAYADGSTKMTDPYGQTSTYVFRKVFDTQYIASSAQPCSSCGVGGVSAYEYNSAGDPVQVRDFNGNLTVLSYNTRKLPTQMTVASGTPEAQTESVLWHPVWRLPTRINEPSATGGAKVTELVYNGLGEPETISVTADGVTRIWRYTYNARGQVTSEDGPRTDVDDISRYTYDDAGNLATVTDANRQVTRFTQYDAAGKLLTKIDPNGTSTLYGYDDRDRLRTVTVVPPGQATGETTVYLHDDAGHLTRLQLPDGSALTYGYDDAGRLTNVRDTLGNRIVYTLNAAGDRIKEDSYDPQNRLAQTLSRTYNHLGRMTELKGADADDITRLGYDLHGNETTMRSPLHAQAAASEYDPLHRIKASVDPLNGRVGYKYDAQDNLREVTDPRGLKTGYTYNGFDELTALASPDTGNAQYRYDVAGNLAQKTDSRGIASTYAYDAANRLLQIAYPDETLDYTYDEAHGGAGAQGRLTTLSDGSGRTRYSYDAQGRVIAKVQQLGADTNTAARKTIGMAYANGLPAGMQVPSGATVAYRYGSDGRTREILVNGQVIVSEIDHHLFDGPRGWITPAGRYQRSFDLDGRISAYSRGTRSIALQYDAAGRITGQGDWTYGYDDNDRLVSADGPQRLRWTYDATGNRTEQRSTVGTTQVANAYSIEATSNRLTSIDANTRQYDAAGNTSNADGKTYVYNGRNRMAEVRQGASVLARYAYNAVGERVCMANSGGSCPTANSPGNNFRQYIYDDAGHLLGEYDSTGNLIAEHLWLGDTPVAVFKPASSAAVHGGLVAGDVAIYFVHPDHLDSPRSVINVAGVEIWSWDSAPFGETPANESPNGRGQFAYSLRFPGQQFDATTGLYYNYFRDYEAGTGRYVQSDPIGLHGGFNTYVYVRSTPLRFADPTGEYIPPPEDPPPLPDPKPAKPKNKRKKWTFKDGFCEWDSQHGEWEIYNKRGVHQGACSPCGTKWKPAVKGRYSEP